MIAAVADSSALFAAADAADPSHSRALAVLERRDLRVVIPALTIGEVSYLIGTRLGPEADAAFLRDLSRHDVELPDPGDWQRIAELVEVYSDFPLGGVDASVIALAERLQTATVITLDRRHFSVVRPRHCEVLELLPE